MLLKMLYSTMFVHLSTWARYFCEEYAFASMRASYYLSFYVANSLETPIFHQQNGFTRFTTTNVPRRRRFAASFSFSFALALSLSLSHNLSCFLSLTLFLQNDEMIISVYLSMLAAFLIYPIHHLSSDHLFGGRLVCENYFHLSFFGFSCCVFFVLNVVFVIICTNY